MEKRGPLQGRVAQLEPGLVVQALGWLACHALPGASAGPGRHPGPQPHLDGELQVPPANPGSGQAGHSGRTVPLCLSLHVGTLMLRICGE